MTPQIDPNHEVSGRLLLGMIGSINEEAIRPYREKHGLVNIEADGWYPMQKVVDFFDDLESNPNGMFNLVSVGMEVGKNIPFPPEVKTVQQALGIFTTVNSGMMRGGKGGSIEVNFINDQHMVLLISDVLIPADATYGVCYSVVKRFLPAGSDIVVERELIGDIIKYDVTW